MPRLENAEQYRRASVSTLLQTTRKVVEGELARSHVLDEHDLDAIPRFDRQELVLGKVVGRGGFCVVRECNAIQLTPNDTDGDEESSKSSSRKSNKILGRGASFGTRRLDSNLSQDSSMLSTREYLARRVWSRKGGKYIVKMVEPELFHKDRVTFLKGMIDIALETKYLASLNHTHILKLRGMCCTSPYEEQNYFVILDQLTEILPKRLNAWMHQKRATKGITGVLTGGKRNANNLLCERLLVAYDVAEAIDYLHANQIIYRDLKPDNIGFNSEGVLKIFDFGLAKELIEEERDDDGLYHMTGFTGSMRYMAPEVGLRRPYNLKADVYSWSMLFWYILALEPPFGFYTPKMFIDRVFTKGYRPAIKDKWPETIRDLMRKCWSEHIHERPTFKDVTAALKKQTSLMDPQIASFMGDSSSTGDLRNGGSARERAEK